MTRPKEMKILSDDEVKILLEMMLDVMPYPAKEMFVLNNINPEDSIRMQSLTKTFRNAREMGNQTLKDVSGKTKIPQYRIRAIEEGKLSEIKPKLLRQLSQYYDLDEWCLRWAVKNTELASGLGMLSWVELNKREKDLIVAALSDNEKLIMENMDDFFQGKTVVVVAHRLSTVKNADQIVVLEEGEIVENLPKVRNHNFKAWVNIMFVRNILMT